MQKLFIYVPAFFCFSGCSQILFNNCTTCYVIKEEPVWGAVDTIWSDTPGITDLTNSDLEYACAKIADSLNDETKNPNDNHVYRCSCETEKCN